MWELWTFLSFYAIWVRLHSDVYSHTFGHCVIFSGKKVTAPAQVRGCSYAYGCSWTILQLFRARLTLLHSHERNEVFLMLSFHHFPSSWQFLSTSWQLINLGTLRTCVNIKSKLSHYRNGGNIKTIFFHSWRNIVSVNCVRISYTSFKSELFIFRPRPKFFSCCYVEQQREGSGWRMKYIRILLADVVLSQTLSALFCDDIGCTVVKHVTCFLPN